jgi:hypothetical protein
MSDSLRAMAKKAESMPFFLASVLAVYAKGEQLDDDGLARVLGCSREDLAYLALCQAPRMEVFWDDITSIAERVKIDPVCLAEIVKRGRVLARLQEEPATEGGFLMAARDREEPLP